MANVYVDSAAVGTGTGANWANAYTTLGAATAAKAAGDDFWIASGHSETQASALTITFPGTATSPNRCLSVNKAGSVPPVAADILAGAAVATTGASTITINGRVYVYGVNFSAGSAANTAKIDWAEGGTDSQLYDTCGFTLNNSSASSQFVVDNTGNGGIKVKFIGCTFTFGTNASQSWGLRSLAEIIMIGGTITAGTFPTTLFNASAGAPTKIVLDGVDLSGFGSGKTLVQNNQQFNYTFSLINCKLGASVTVAAAGGSTGGSTDLIGCNSTTNVERNERYRYEGTLTTETTIVRTTGATDGTTAYSWKIVSTANAKRTFPFETFEGAVWNTATSSKTLTVHCVTDNVTLTDAEIWLEVEYLASGAAPVSTLITDANATVLTTAANQTTSAAAWTTTGLTTPVYQQMDVTFTPAMAGPIRWRVKVAKASTTVYVCPLAVLS